MGAITLRPGAFGGAVAFTDASSDHGAIVHYDISVEGTTGVDCLIFDRSAWDAYQAGDHDVDPVSVFSRLDVTETTTTVRVEGGEYPFAIDNTRVGTDPGPNTVTMHHVFEIAEPV